MGIGMLVKRNGEAPYLLPHIPTRKKEKKDIEVILYSNPNVIGITLITRYKPE